MGKDYIAEKEACEEKEREMDKLWKTPVQKMRNELMWDYLKTDRWYMTPMVWLKIYFYLDQNIIYD